MSRSKQGIQGHLCVNLGSKMWNMSMKMLLLVTSVLKDFVFNLSHSIIPVGTYNYEK
jgi:hypothetical protein